MTWEKCKSDRRNMLRALSLWNTFNDCYENKALKLCVLFDDVGCFSAWDKPNDTY